MSIKAVGETVLMDGHWWTAAAPTSDGFLMVNITTIYPDFAHDPACVLKGGCLPFVPHDSYIFYHQASVKTLAAIQSHLGKLDCVVVNQIPLILQIRVLRGFAVSRYSNKRHREIAAQHLASLRQPVIGTQPSVTPPGA